MKVKSTAFRASLYKMLDRIEETGEVLEIERKGTIFRVTPVQKGSRLERLPKREVMNVSPESFVESDWSEEWNHDLP